MRLYAAEDALQGLLTHVRQEQGLAPDAAINVVHVQASDRYAGCWAEDEDISIALQDCLSQMPARVHHALADWSRSSS